MISKVISRPADPTWSCSEISDHKNPYEYVKEICEIVEGNQKITEENQIIFEKIESASKDLKQSMI